MRTTSAAISALVALPGALASPTEAQYNEVIPGPGLPSLASLGLTSKMLYEMPFPKLEARSDLHARFNGLCGPNDSAYTDVGDLIACYHYLDNLGTTQCGVPFSGVEQFCTAGQGQATGESITGAAESSYCSDVAYGLLVTINSCTRPDQTCAGYQAANGNGNLVVGGVNINY